MPYVTYIVGGNASEAPHILGAFTDSINEYTEGMHKDLMSWNGTKRTASHIAGRGNVSIPRYAWNALNTALRRDRRRPDEHGQRPDSRETGKLGVNDSARFREIYKGVQPPRSGNRFFIGWPNTQHADKATNGAWRALEHGLLPAGASTGASSPHFGPAGFIFNVGGEKEQPSETKRGGFLQPTTRASRGLSGYTGKLFLEKGFNEALKSLPGEYEGYIAAGFRAVFTR